MLTSTRVDNPCEEKVHFDLAPTDIAYSAFFAWRHTFLSMQKQAGQVAVYLLVSNTSTLPLDYCFRGSDASTSRLPNTVGRVLCGQLPILAFGVKAIVFTFNQYLDAASGNCGMREPSGNCRIPWGSTDLKGVASHDTLRPPRRGFQISSLEFCYKVSSKPQIRI